MNIIKVTEDIIKEWTVCDKLAANLAANSILDTFETLGFELVEKKEKEEVGNITKAIEGLTAYMEAISEMDAEEFDYCYNKLIHQGIDHLNVERYITALKIGMK